VAERHFPIGLQRLATLEWPDKPLEGGGETAQRSRLEQLAVQNDRLRDNERRLRESSDRKLNELKEQIATTRGKLHDQRLAAQVGRAVATTLPAAAFAGLYVWILLKFAPWETVLLNVGIIVGGLVTLFGLLSSALKRLQLLARPADRLLEWVSTLGSAATDLIKARKQ
jgi:hypothetical protein